MFSKLIFFKTQTLQFMGCNINYSERGYIFYTFENFIKYKVKFFNNFQKSSLRRQLIRYKHIFI